MSRRYTAVLYYNDQELANHSDNDLRQLSIILLTLIESTRSGTRGVITDNYHGKVIQRCQKASIE